MNCPYPAPDAKKFGDTKSREFRKPESAATAVVRPRARASNTRTYTPTPTLTSAVVVVVSAAADAVCHARTRRPGEEDGREGSGRTEQVLEGT